MVFTGDNSVDVTVDGTRFWLAGPVREGPDWLAGPVRAGWRAATSALMPLRGMATTAFRGAISALNEDIYAGRGWLRVRCNCGERWIGRRRYGQRLEKKKL